MCLRSSWNISSWEKGFTLFNAVSFIPGSKLVLTKYLLNEWLYRVYMVPIYQGFPDSSVGKGSACNAGDPGSIPGLWRSAEEGTGYPLQYCWASLVAQLVKNLPVMRQMGWIPGLGRSPGEGDLVFWPEEFHGLYKSMGSQSQTQLSDFHFLSLSYSLL